MLIALCVIIALKFYATHVGKFLDFEFLKNDVVIYERRSNGMIVYEIAKNHETSAGKTKVI